MATAYAALVSLLNDLDLIPNHPRHSFSFENNQIRSLSQTLHFLIDFMESYDSHGCNREAAEFLESRIASAALEAHDMVESYVVDQIHAGFTLCGKPRSYFLPALQKAIDNMDNVKRDVMQLKAEQPTSYSPPTSSAPHTSKNNMVGFDAVLARLLAMLTGEPPNRLVIPIEGMGGIGKTTLAKNGYEHTFSVNHFDVRCWATISQQYSAQSILTQLLFGKQNCTDQDVSLLQNELHKKLWRRRYLIILDDMWNIEAWDEIQMYLPENDNGSRVIITTRLSNLASKLNSSPFKMKFLDVDQSWNLFCVEAFDEGKCPVELEKIGRKIVGRCQGLPLSIVVIGGHLRKSTRVVEYWEKVSNFMSPISSSEEGEKSIEIISLSYYHLPIYLKPCFLSMGKFMEDQSIYVANLIRFWVGEGLIKPKEGLSLEQVAEDCLEDLIDRNLVIAREKGWNGKPKYCGIHDIVREFCLKMGKKERFLRVVNNKEGVSGERCIVIQNGKHNYDELLLEFRSLRVSEGDESYVAIRGDNESWLDANFEQVNLRYLRYGGFNWLRKIYKLPSSISLLWNLQTLILDFLVIKTIAPKVIWEMTQLRHLHFFELHLPDPLQECIVLRNLQTLKTVRNLRLTEEICERMPNIKELSLLYDSKLCSYWCLQDLCLFNKLESLKLRLSGHALLTMPLLLPSSVQELDLEVPGLHWEDLGTMIKSLPYLGYLSLSRVEGHEWSLVDEEFPCLKYLVISECSDLIYWNANSSHFPALQTLFFDWVYKLSEIPFDIGDIPSLACITLIDCSVSAAVSAMRILVEQERHGNEDLLLLVNFNEMEEVDIFQRKLQEHDLQSKSLRLSHQRSRLFDHSMLQF